MTAVAAVLYGVLTVIVVLFQAALAFGMPWGRLAMGGRFPGRLPPAMRAASVMQALLLVLFAALVLARAGIAFPGLAPVARPGIFVVVAVSALSALLNLITPSRWERITWAPVAVVQLLTSAMVAWG